MATGSDEPPSGLDIVVDRIDRLAISVQLGFDDVHDNLRVMRGDITVMRDDLNQVRNDIGGINRRLGRMETRLESLEDAGLSVRLRLEQLEGPA